MRLSRRNFVPLLTIVAGGAIGASLSFSFLALSPSGDVRVIAPIVTTYESVEVLRLEAAKANSMDVYIFEQTEAPRLEEQRYTYVVRMQDIEARRLLAMERARGLSSEEPGSRPRP